MNTGVCFESYQSEKLDLREKSMVLGLCLTQQEVATVGCALHIIRCSCTVLSIASLSWQPAPASAGLAGRPAGSQRPPMRPRPALYADWCSDGVQGD